MDISVTELKQRCLELVREVEATGKPVAITRRGRVVARIEPAPRARPWERMRGRGKWLAAPGERFSSTTRSINARTRRREQKRKLALSRAMRGVWRKTAALGITERDIENAVRWARRRK